MKIASVILILFSAFLTQEVLRGAEPDSTRSKSVVKMRDAATHDQLSSRLRIAQQKDPIQDLGPPKGNTTEDPAKNAPKDLIKESTILCFRGNLTLLPKGSVLHVPEKLGDRIGVRPNVKVKTWDSFIQQNRGWIRTVEVTRDQAKGYRPLGEAVVESFQSGSSVVIATFKGRPISVLPEKSSEEIPLPSENKPVTYR